MRPCRPAIIPDEERQRGHQLTRAALPRHGNGTARRRAAQAEAGRQGDTAAAECREAQLFPSLESPAETAAAPAAQRRGAARSLRYGAGGITGDLEFFLRQRRSFGAVCTADARALRLGADAYRRMLAEAPLVAVMLQHMVVHNEMHSTASHMKMVQQGAAALG